MMGRRSKLYVDIDEDDIQRSNITDEVIPIYRTVIGSSYDSRLGSESKYASVPL
jgi:hypothetical protein